MCDDDARQRCTGDFQSTLYEWDLDLQSPAYMACTLSLRQLIYHTYMYSVYLFQCFIVILTLFSPRVDHTVAHSFLHQVLCRAQATLPSSSSPSSPAHRRQVLSTCIADLLCVGGLDSQLSDRAECAATFLQCQLLGEEVGCCIKGSCDCHVTIV